MRHALPLRFVAGASWGGSDAMIETSTPAGPRSLSPPPARGPLSSTLLEALSQEPGTAVAWPASVASADPVGDEDLQLALYLCYELHYGGIAGVDPAWE